MRSPIAPAAINARKTHCLNGHEFAPGNIYWQRDGGRGCRTCALERARQQKLRRRATPQGRAIGSLHRYEPIEKSLAR
jgi:hypothetical protein